MIEVLFICSNLNVGGFQKSLVSLLQNFDYDKYNVDLLLLEKNGVFFKHLPENVNIIETEKFYSYSLKTTRGFLYLLLKHPIIFVYKALAMILFKFNKCWSAYFSAKSYPKISKKYSVSIDYCGQSLLYYLVDRISSEIKISFFHSDYKKWRYYEKLDRKYYKKIDHIVTVSSICVDSMKTVFPEYSEKIQCIENITTKKTIDLFRRNISPFLKNKNEYVFVSVGRICVEKGIDISIEAASILKENGIKFKWYMIGPCLKRDISFFNQMIHSFNLEQDIIFTGQTDNPYDFLSFSDIVIHSSLFEGKAVAIDEAMLLNKIVITTPFTTVFDQILNNETGVICEEFTSASLSKNILRTIKNHELQKKIHLNLTRYAIGNSNEIEKLYALFKSK